MRPLTCYASRSSFEYVSQAAAGDRLSRSSSQLSQRLPRPWVCQQCRHQSQSLLQTPRRGPSKASDRYTKGFIPTCGQSPVTTSVEGRASLSTQKNFMETDGRNIQQNARTELPSQEEGRRSHISKRFTHVMDHLQSNIFIAGQRLNDLTGYSGIEALKKDIEDQGILAPPTFFTS